MTEPTALKTINISPKASDEDIALALRELREGKVAAVAFPYPVKFSRLADDGPTEAGESGHHTGTHENDAGNSINTSTDRTEKGAR